jgi:hypothetical protein
MSTALEELEAAALYLARSGPIKERLADAYRNHLAWLNPEDLPAALRAQFRACQDALTRERPLRGEDAVRATVRKMSNHDADEVAGAVVRLFAAMAREALAHGVAADGALAAGAAPNGAHLNGLNGAHLNGLNGAHLNGLNGADPRPRNEVPQVVALYSAEA